jgi:putative membrane protein
MLKEVNFMYRICKRTLAAMVVSASALHATAALAQSGRYGGGMMNPGYHGFWGMGWMGLLFWGLILVAVVGLIRWLWQAGNRKQSVGGDRALDILKERYARGEIDKKTFESMKKDIDS